MNGMYTKTSTVTILDAKLNNPCIRDIDLSSLFIKYSYLVDNDTIVFNDNHPIKIEDWYGWTDLISITKVSNEKFDKNLSLLYTMVNNDIHNIMYVGEDTIIPLFNMSKMIKGYHGETKYERLDITAKYIQTSIIDYSDYAIRSRLNYHEFVNVVNNKSLSNIGDYNGDNELDSLYIVNTRSGMLMVNNLYLCDN